MLHNIAPGMLKSLAMKQIIALGMKSLAMTIEFNCSQYCYEVPHDLGNLDFPSFPNL
ncbi:hypothetical protein Tco_0056402, partial [Tanacetum coccineum]